MEPTSSITQRRAWFADLHAKGYVVLAPDQVIALLDALGPAQPPVAERSAFDNAVNNLRDARRIYERLHR